MKTISVEQPGHLYLGMQGENGAQPIGFDVQAWEKKYGPGRVELLVQRYGDDAPYPMVLRREGSVVIWQVKQADTLYAGAGQAQLLYFVEGKVVKSRCFTTDVTRSLGGPSPDAPAAQEDWVQQVLTVSGKVETAAQQTQRDAASAETSRQAAEASQRNAKASEDAAAASKAVAEKSAAQAEASAMTATECRQQVQQWETQARESADAAEQAGQQAALHCETAEKAAQEAESAAVKQSFVQTQESGTIVSGRFAPGEVQLETHWNSGTVSPEQIRVAICRGNVFAPVDTAIGSGGVNIYSMAGKVTVSGSTTLPYVREKAFDKGVWLPAGTYTLKLEKPCRENAFSVQVCHARPDGTYRDMIAQVTSGNTCVVFQLQEAAVVNLFVQVSSSLQEVHWSSYVWIEYGDTQNQNTAFDTYQRQDLVQPLRNVHFQADSSCKFCWNQGVAESIHYETDGRITVERTELQTPRNVQVPYGRYTIMTDTGTVKVTAKRHPEEAIQLLREQVQNAPKILPQVPKASPEGFLPGYQRVNKLDASQSDVPCILVARDRTFIGGESGKLVVQQKKDGATEVADVYAKSFSAGAPGDYHAYMDNNFGFGVWTGGGNVIGTSWSGENLRFVSMDHVEFRSGNSDESPFIAIDALAFNQKSSRRYKHAIAAMSDACAEKLLSLRPVSFVYNNDPTQKTTYGMIAEEVETVDNTACSYAEGVVDSIDYSKFVPQLIKLCQMQQKQIQRLQERVDAIEKRYLTENS